jgi:hypothetical protein
MKAAGRYFPQVSPLMEIPQGKHPGKYRKTEPKMGPRAEEKIFTFSQYGSWMEKSFWQVFWQQIDLNTQE